MPGAKPPISKPYIPKPYTTYPPYCQTIVKRFGHYTSQTLVCQVFCMQNMPKKASDFLSKDLNTFKKPYKSL
jgi:hypothetical protein